MAIFVSVESRASLYLEPYLGINFSGEFKQGSSNFEYDNYPISIGGRIGYGQLGFSGGLDYQITDSIDLDNVSGSFKSTDVAFFIGYQFPILVRCYAAYIFNSDFEKSGTIYDEGTGTKIGVGYSGLPFVNLNFDIKQVSYDKVNGSSVNADNNVYLLSVSLPLNL